MMDFIGGLLGKLFGGSNILSNFPAMLVSFFTIRWAVDKLEFRKYIDNVLLFIVISLPNFCIWTSVVSKETVGLVFSAILGVLIINFLNGKYKLHLRDWFALYLCLIFKPQYFPFILETLVFIWFAKKYCKTALSRFLLGILLIVINLGLLYGVRNFINEYAELFPVHFLAADAGANRNEGIWNVPDGFFKEAPAGMFIAFVGPTIGEMVSKPTFLIAGLEGWFIALLLIYFLAKFLFSSFIGLRIKPVMFFSCVFIFTGLAFVHYPFGIFNAGSAIRYRTNFIFLFILLAMEIYRQYRAQVNPREE